MLKKSVAILLSFMLLLSVSAYALPFFEGSVWDNWFSGNAVKSPPPPHIVPDITGWLSFVSFLSGKKDDNEKKVRRHPTTLLQAHADALGTLQQKISSRETIVVHGIPLDVEGNALVHFADEIGVLKGADLRPDTLIIFTQEKSFDALVQKGIIQVIPSESMCNDAVTKGMQGGSGIAQGMCGSQGSNGVTSGFRAPSGMTNNPATSSYNVFVAQPGNSGSCKAQRGSTASGSGGTGSSQLQSEQCGGGGTGRESPGNADLKGPSAGGSNAQSTFCSSTTSTQASLGKGEQAAEGCTTSCGASISNEEPPISLQERTDAGGQPKEVLVTKTPSGEIKQQFATWDGKNYNAYDKKGEYISTVSKSEVPPAAKPTPQEPPPGVGDGKKTGMTGFDSDICSGPNCATVRRIVASLAVGANDHSLQSQAVRALHSFSNPGDKDENKVPSGALMGPFAARFSPHIFIGPKVGTDGSPLADSGGNILVNGCEGSAGGVTFAFNAVGTFVNNHICASSSAGEGGSSQCALGSSAIENNPVLRKALHITGPTTVRGGIAPPPKAVQK